MTNKILMRHLAQIISSKIGKIHAKALLLWHKNDIIAISVKRDKERLCHITSGFLDQIHINDITFDLKESNSYNAIISTILTNLKLPASEH